MFKDFNYEGMAIITRGKENVKAKAKQLFTRKKDGAKGILEENGLLIVGVVLLFIFKDVAITLITSLGTFVGDKIKTLFTGI